MRIQPSPCCPNESCKQEAPNPHETSVTRIYFQVVTSLSFSTQEPICCSIELFWIQHRFHFGATQKYSLLTSTIIHVTKNLIKIEKVNIAHHGDLVSHLTDNCFV